MVELEQMVYIFSVLVFFAFMLHRFTISHTSLIIRGGVLKDVLGLKDTFSSPWPWPRSLKSSKIALSLAQGQHYFLNR